MKLGKKFNQLTKSEYFYYINNFKKYTDFNTLALYRSICENNKLDISDKIEIRDYANKYFEKTFNFLQLKDPMTYFELITLGEDLTKADEEQIWKNIRKNQQNILENKKNKHRNFGVYSKHDCGYEDCPYNGLMIHKDIWLYESHIWFESDKHKLEAKKKSEKRKSQRKNIYKIINSEYEHE